MKPQDIPIVLATHLMPREGWTSKRVAEILFLSHSNVHAGVRRLQASKLLVSHPSHRIAVDTDRLFEFLVHGMPYVYPAEVGALTRGMPTAYAAPPLSHRIVAGGEPPPVWPFAEGSVRGYSFLPLYPNAPKAASGNASLYELLALADTLRSGRAREIQIAREELASRLGVKP